MKRKTFRVLSAILLSALCLTVYLNTRGAGAEKGKLTLWYAETDCPRPVMEALLESYREQTRRTVEAKAFPDETSLGEAFDKGRPDLLLCGHARAWDLARREKLSAPETLPPLPDTAEGVTSRFGGSFYPLGARVQLLLRDEKTMPEAPASMEKLFRMAETAGRPTLAVDSLAELLQTGMLSLGGKLGGTAEANSRDERYVRLYNALAAAAFTGGLAETDDPVLCVRQGLLPCAAVRSTALAGREGETLAVSALPLPEGGARVYAAELMGFVFLGDGTSSGEAGELLNWLAAGERDAALALRAGLVPLRSGKDAPGENALEAALLSLAGEDCLRFSEAESGAAENREALEAQLRQGLDLLR